MSELSEEEIARVVRQAMLSNPDGGPFRHRETERSLIASEAARLVLALLQPALERARREERERLAVWHDNEAKRWNAVLWDRRSWGGPTMGAEECIHAEKLHKDTAAAIRKG